MPLSTSADREPLHTRSITCRGYRRADGLWDIEGHLRDVKDYSFQSDHRGEVEAGAPIHDMWLRLTIDDEFEVRDVEAVTDASPYPSCPGITPNFKRLIGLKIGSGWRREIHRRLGGIQGCTHLVELLGPVGTTAYQTMFSERMRRRREEAAKKGDEMTASEFEEAAPRLLNSCHAFSEAGPVVKERWPAFYKDDGHAAD
jgi:hypothetical protein